MDERELANIAMAVNRWLSYQILCGREALLSEAYLGYPLAEYLINRHTGKFETEENHPVLNNPRPGRPKQIDYVLLTKTKKAIEVAIECKWITTSSYDKQRILNDILRLECVRVDGRHVGRFLLVAGRKDDFDKNFKELQFNIGGGREKFTKALLSFSSKKPSKSVKPVSAAKFSDYYRRFAASFNSSVPRSFKTTLVSRKTADNIAVCIWQISSVSNRRVFSPPSANAKSS